jgi:hypothetical protein
MRPCSKCKKEFELSVFSPDPKTGKLRRTYCPDCRREYERQKRAENPEKARERAKQWRQKNWDAAKAAAYKWRLAHPETWKAATKRWREKHQRDHSANVRKTNRDKVYDHYGRTCTCCGEDQIMFLTIDHIDNDGATHRKEMGNRGGSSFFAWMVSADFPSGFQVLCRNCNWGKHVNGGVCPHQTSEGSETIPKGSTAKRPEARGT